MVLAELGGRISRALQQLNNATVIDEKVLGECLNEICRALLQADVQFKMVQNMQANIKRTVNFDKLAAGHNKRRIIQKAVFNELCSMLDPGKPAFVPKKGKPNVIMFVGLQGSGKTTTCTKYAYHYQTKGWKPALVCADTFRAGAFDQLKQNAKKAKIPFFGSYTETDPVKIAQEGVETFRNEHCDLIIVDTSGRHKQDAALFEEMRQVAEVTAPDLVIFVMDSSIGQAAFDQAQAFKQSAAVGAVIVTKMDGHAKGGGALSAVSATKSPIIFLGNGEHMDDFEAFETKPFVSRLLGRVDWSGFVDKVQEVVPMEQPQELLHKLTEGTLRFMYELYRNTLNNGVSQVMSTIPGLKLQRSEKENQFRMKKFMTIMDSMTNEELDSTSPKLIREPSRVNRVARGSGRDVEEVMDMLEEFKQQMKGPMKGPKTPKKGGMGHMNVNDYMSKVLPPHMLRQIGGMSGLQSLIKQMGS